MYITLVFSSKNNTSLILYMYIVEVIIENERERESEVGQKHTSSSGKIHVPTWKIVREPEQSSCRLVVVFLLLLLHLVSVTPLIDRSTTQVHRHTSL